MTYFLQFLSFSPIQGLLLEKTTLSCFKTSGSSRRFAYTSRAAQGACRRKDSVKPIEPLRIGTARANFLKESQNSQIEDAIMVGPSKKHIEQSMRRSSPGLKPSSLLVSMMTSRSLQRQRNGSSEEDYSHCSMRLNDPALESFSAFSLHMIIHVTLKIEDPQCDALDQHLQSDLLSPSTHGEKERWMYEVEYHVVQLIQIASTLLARFERTSKAPQRSQQ